MKKRGILPLAALMAALILDSRCAAASAAASLELCLRTLIPALFPLLVVGAMLVPRLSQVRLRGLSRLLGIPEGSEGIAILGCVGGFPVGAACAVQAVQSGGLDRKQAQRMLGMVSFCGPSFLFGVIGNVLSTEQAAMLFLIQLETAVLLGLLWPGSGGNPFRGDAMEAVSIGDALLRSIRSMALVCGWVVLAGVAGGLLRKWTASFLPSAAVTVLSGILELTNGVLALPTIPSPVLRLILCTGFVCFGGVSVLLQIGALASSAGIPMKTCILQKSVQAMLGMAIAAGAARFGWAALLPGCLLPAAKIAVEISGRMVYNGERKEGI